MNFLGILDYEGKCCLVSEFYAQGDLEQCHNKELGLHKMPRLAQLLLDIASGMLHLHSQKPNPIIHRDIRCANILLHADGHAVLGDWGLSRSIESEEAKEDNTGEEAKQQQEPDWFHSKPSKSGYVASSGSMTPWPWTAPEALLCGVYSTSSDGYMMGVTIWEILVQGGDPYNWTRVAKPRR